MCEILGVQIPFTKLHGLGNDFVLIDGRHDKIGPLSKSIVRAIADRKRGVGFDQLLFLKPSRRVDATLEIYNADGSMAEMCGNGLRAAALYLWLRGSKGPLTFQTCAGDRRARALGRATAHDALIECEMGAPRFLALPKPLARGVRLGSKTIIPICVNVGNPHAVSFVYPLRQCDLEQWGRRIETHKAFPRRTNAEFVRVRGRDAIDVQVWERGVGVTEACGTGAVASACAAILAGLVRGPVRVRFPGGQAVVRWAGHGATAYLQGRASEVFSSVFSYRR